MPLTRYVEGVTGFSSTFIFTKVTFSPCSAASSSRIGPTWRHGPHHSAQKSTRTGLSDLRTSASKLSSVTACRSDMWCSFVLKTGGFGVLGIEHHAPDKSSLREGGRGLDQAPAPTVAAPAEVIAAKSRSAR